MTMEARVMSHHSRECSLLCHSESYSSLASVVTHKVLYDVTALPPAILVLTCSALALSS